jgi:ubiquinone/menaquinone biosynthesis C-methylase UbiE
MDTYNIRQTDYKQTHGFSGETLEKLAESLELFEGARFLDLMAGKGTVADAVVKFYSQRKISVLPTLLDGYRPQLPDQASYPLVVCDARGITLPSESFDGVAVKLGLHEIPHVDKLRVFDEVYRLLKESGLFSMWEVALENPRLQEIFSKIIRKKDELAGFSDLAENRYFMRKDEIIDFLNTSGFTDIQVYSPGIFNVVSSRWLNSDFKNDVAKLTQYNHFIRTIVPEDIRAQIKYFDKRDSISMTFNQPIIRARKTKHRNLFLDLHTAKRKEN